NLSIQRAILSNFVVTAAYAGSRGINLVRGGDINAPLPQFLSDGRKFYPGPIAGVLPRRNPRFSTIDLKRADGNSWYNALQLSLDKRFSQGLQVQVRYTFSKSIDETQGTNSTDSISEVPQALDPDNRKTDRGRSEFDVRHVFAASFVYDLPSVEQLGSLTGLIFGDWQFGGITMLRSGSPFTVGIQSNRSNTGHSAA